MISWLLKVTKGFRGRIILSVLFGSLTVGSSIALLGTSAFLIASAATQPSIAVLQVPIVGVRFFGISRSVLRYIERLLSHSVNLKLLTNIRIWVYKNLLQTYPFRDKEKSNTDILNTLSQDINTLENFYVRLLSPIIVTIFVLMSVAAYFGFFAWQLSLMIITGLLLTGFIFPWFAFKSGKNIAIKGSAAKQIYQNHLVSFFESYQELSLLQPRSEIINSLSSAEKKWAKQKENHNIFQSFNNSLSTLTVQLIFLVIMVISAVLVFDQKINPIMMAVFSLIILASFETAATLPSAFHFLGDTQVAANRILELSKPYDDKKSKNLNTGIGISDTPITISIKNLSFRYTPQRDYVLQGFNCELTPEKKIAIVGESGVGKSTLVNILMGFFNDYDGNILINGIDFRQLPQEEIRNLISYVAPDLYFFETSLKQNFLLANNNLDNESIKNYLTTVQMENTTPELDLETDLSEFGENFSAGERQRLHLAQSLSRDGMVFLLDEPTANLDPITSKNLIKNLFQVLNKKNLIWITHQFFFMEKFDEIIVLKDQKIIESGTHQKLMERKGEYFHLYSAFFQKD